MKKENTYSRNRKEIKTSKCFSCPLQLAHSSINPNKIENKIIHKESLKEILSEIKTSVNDILSNIDKSKNKNIKKILLKLKNNLTQILKEKNNILNEFYNKKNDLQNKIFNEINNDYVKKDIINDNKILISLISNLNYFY